LQGEGRVRGCFQLQEPGNAGTGFRPSHGIRSQADGLLTGDH